MSTEQPAISAIFFTLTDFEAIRRIATAWSRQTIADQIEAVFVTPDPESLELDDAVAAAFQSTMVVECRRIEASACMRVAGIRAASAPFVAITEDHCYPERRWAERVVAKLEEGYDGVCGSFSSGNPGDPMAWGNILVEYLEWMPPLGDLEPGFIAGHNSMYRRDALLELDEELEKLFEVETALHWQMGERLGSRFAVEPSARQHHLNFEKVIPSYQIRFLAGWSFADGRRLPWGWPKRLFYAAASPLIPFVRMRRIWPKMKALEQLRITPMVAVHTFASLAFDAAGQMAGYLAPIPDWANALLTDYETRRERFMKRPVPRRFAVLERRTVPTEAA